jgi:CrcB protein
MLKAIIFVGMGGFMGSVGRYMISHWLLKFNHQFPTGTLLVNLAGSFLIGLIIASSLKQSELWRLLLVTGFCGGFTTFSAFSLENLRMLQEGQVLSAIQYIVISLIGGLFLAFLGYALGTKLLT